MHAHLLSILTCLTFPPPLDPHTSCSWSQWNAPQSSGPSSDVIPSEEPCLCPQLCNTWTWAGPLVPFISYPLPSCSGIACLISSLHHHVVRPQLTTAPNTGPNVWHTTDTQWSDQMCKWINWMNKTMTRSRSNYTKVTLNEGSKEWLSLDLSLQMILFWFENSWGQPSAVTGVSKTTRETCRVRVCCIRTRGFRRISEESSANKGGTSKSKHAMSSVLQNVFLIDT